MDKKEKKDRDRQDDQNKNLKDRLESSEEELQKMLDELSKQNGGKRVKVIRIGGPILSKKDKILKNLLTIVFDIIIVMAVSGYINWFDIEGNIYFYLAIFSLIFTFLDIIFKSLIMEYFTRFLMLTFGGLFLLSTIVAFVIAAVTTPNLLVTSQSNVILFMILFLMLRQLVGIVLVNKLFILKKLK